MNEARIGRKILRPSYKTVTPSETLVRSARVFELDDIESVFPKGAVAGERYADMSSVGL
jgi:hypothetical protein